MTTTRERETIVAPATAPGRAALAVVRLSGPATMRILTAVFSRSGEREIPVRRPVLGWFRDRQGNRLDEGTAIFFRGPKSYTGEDLAELTVHGSPAIVRELVAALAGAGARLAGPGEFTMRALEAGKVDLARAEAVRDLIEAATLEQARVAARQLGGEVSETIGPLAEDLLDVLADLEAGLDFPEDEQHLVDPVSRIASRCRDLVARIDAVRGASEAARRVREGARVVLLGPPNAGKSSLFNALVGADRVIVTPEPGTTRDLVEETVVIEGLPVVLVDAAGVGEARGVAEHEGMRRAVAAAREAHLVLDVYDASRGEAPPAADGHLAVGTHADAAPGATDPGDLRVSSVTGEGLNRLRQAIGAALEAPGNRPLESVALATDRHREAAARAADALSRAADLADRGWGAEMVAVDLREAVDALREILGVVGPDDLLGRIFSRFCIGK